MAKNDLPDGKKIIQRILDLLKQLIEEAERVGGPISQHIKDDFHKYDDEYRTIKSKKKLTIAVAGKFSSGKSKFINSLFFNCLSREIAPVKLKPTTRCQTVFTADPKWKLKGGEVRIVDSNKKVITEDVYHIKAETAQESFTIYVPIPNDDSDIDWSDIELIDTPGFDSVDNPSDAEISWEAVKKAEVIFFLCDCGAATIRQDSKKLLKKVFELNQRKKLYIILNKADQKGGLGKLNNLNNIIRDIKGLCRQEDISYESIIPYSSIVSEDDEILRRKPEIAHDKWCFVLQLRRDTMKVIKGLVAQARKILAARNREKELGLKKDLKQLAQECVNEVIRTKERRLKDIADDDHIDIESLTASIVKLLLEKAEWYTREGLSNLIKCQELKETGILNFRNDWVVYVGDPDDETYTLSGDDYRVLSSHISTFLHDNGFKSDTTLRDKIISLFRSCSNITIDQYKTDDGDNELLELQAQEKSDFRKRCNREADCSQAEEEIGKNILACFPDDFENACSPKVTEAIEQAVSEIKDQRREALQRTFEQCDDCIDLLSKLFPADTEDEEPLRHPSNGSNNTQKLVKEILDTVDWAELWNKMKKGCASAWQKFRTLIKKGDNHVTQ